MVDYVFERHLSGGIHMLARRLDLADTDAARGPANAFERAADRRGEPPRADD